MPREVHIHNAHPRLKLDRRAVAKVVHTLDAQFAFTEADLPFLTATAKKRAQQQLKSAQHLCALDEGEFSLAFLTDAALARLHADFLDDPSTTDVITFEGNPALGSAGEVCVSADTAAAFAREHDHDFSEELTLYVIHGWLHLVGYDDLKPAKKRRMRAAEKRSLELLHTLKAVPKFTLGTKR